MSDTETTQLIPRPENKIEELAKLQEDFDRKKISLVEFEDKRMEIDREWFR